MGRRSTLKKLRRNDSSSSSANASAISNSKANADADADADAAVDGSSTARTNATATKNSSHSVSAALATSPPNSSSPNLVPTSPTGSAKKNKRQSTSLPQNNLANLNSVTIRTRSENTAISTSSVFPICGDETLRAYLPGLTPLSSCSSSLSSGIDNISNADPSYFGRILPLVTSSESGIVGKLSVNSEAVEVLSRLDGPIAVLAVAGLSRTGKSFLLNQMAGQSTGFEIGASIQPKTQGLWMCVLDAATLKSRGLPSDYTTILIDTEGIGSFTRTETYDAKVFALAVLVSSMLVYNTMGTIDESAMQSLMAAASLARSLRSEQMSCTPSLVWVLRDFALQLQVADNKPLSADAFLEHVLSYNSPWLPNGSNLGDSSVGLHNDIRNMFPSRCCIDLPRPVNDEDDLARLDVIPRSSMRQEYLEKLDYLLKRIHTSISPKSVDGVELNGELLCDMITHYVEALNSDTVPELSNTWAIIIKEQARAAKTNCISGFEHKMAKYAENNEIKTFADLLIIYTDSLGFAETSFLRAMPLGSGDIETTAVILAEIRQAAKAHAIRIHIPRLLSLDHDKNTDLLNSLLNPALEKLDSTKKLAETVNSVLESYNKDSSSAISRYIAFYELDIASKIATRAATLCSLQVDASATELQKTHFLELETARKELASVHDLYKSTDSEWKKEQASVTSLREEADSLHKKISEITILLRTAESDSKTKEEALASATQKLADLETKLFSELKRNKESESALLDEKIILKTKVEQLSLKIKELEILQETASGSAKHAHAELARRTSDVEKRASQLADLEAKLAEVQSQLLQSNQCKAELEFIISSESSAKEAALAAASQTHRQAADEMAAVEKARANAEKSAAEAAALHAAEKSEIEAKLMQEIARGDAAEAKSQDMQAELEKARLEIAENEARALRERSEATASVKAEALREAEIKHAADIEKLKCQAAEDLAVSKKNVEEIQKRLDGVQSQLQEAAKKDASKSCCIIS